MKKAEPDLYTLPQEEDSNITQQIISKYVPYWPLYILAVLLALVGAYVYLHYVTPVYEASATMIVKDERRGTNDMEFLDQINQIAGKKFVENEIEVLQSRALMENVVKRLSLYAPITQKGKVKEGDAYLLSPVTVSVLNPDSIVEVDEVNFTYDKTSNTVTLNGKDKYPVGQFVSTEYGTLKFSPNKYYRPNAESSKQLYFSLIEPSNVAEDYRKGLKAVAGQQSAIVNISCKDIIPQRAVDILNLLIVEYNETTISDKNTLAKSTLSFLNERLGILGRDLDSIQRKMQQYKSGRGAVDVSAQSQILLQNMSGVGAKLGEVDNQLAMLGTLERSVTTKLSEGGIVPATIGLNDPMLTNLTTKLYTAEMEYDRLKKTMGENNPLLQAKADEINKMRPSILENIQSQKQSLNASRSSLYSTSSGYNSLLSTVPTKERDLLEISRDQAIKSQIYSFLLQKKEETELNLASVVASSKTVDKALAGKDPVSPKKKLIYLMAIAGALGLCIGVITIKDFFTGKILYRTEIEKMTSVPIIGEVAFDKSQSPIVIERGTRSFIAEEFRKLRISLSFLGIDSSHKKILVTSSISGEGKSFVAANLAVSISLTGKKVALVDLDLNNPTLSKILNVNQEFGATEVLAGEKKVEEVIKHSDVYENLYFISTGHLPENPTEFLANGRVNSMINYLESNYDMVIIDTSPSVLVTDAYLLSGLCDATLYIIRHNYTPKMLVRRIDENNRINPLHNPAIIFNGVKIRGIFKNNYGYGYDYVYGNKERGGKAKKVS